MTVILDRHIAEAQRRIARRYQIDVHAGNEVARALRPRRPRWFEVEPHASDPMCRLFVARAIEERAWRSNVEPVWLRRHAASSPLVADAIIADAARMLHELARSQAIGCARA